MFQCGAHVVFWNGSIVFPCRFDPAFFIFHPNTRKASHSAVVKAIDSHAGDVGALWKASADKLVSKLPYVPNEEISPSISTIFSVGR